VEIGGRRFVETIGGNEGHSVRVGHVPIGQSGGVLDSQAREIFAMIKLIGC